MNIRPAKVEDLPDMQETNLHNLPENYVLRYYVYHAMSWPECSFVATVPVMEVGGKKRRDKIVGYVLAGKKTDEEVGGEVNKRGDSNVGRDSKDEEEAIQEFAKQEREGHMARGHITSISVLRTYRRMGIASKLMDLALESLGECYGASAVSLHVRKSNKAALGLYRDKLKFNVIKIESSYYGDGEDAYSMEKLLKINPIITSGEIEKNARKTRFNQFKGRKLQINHPVKLDESKMDKAFEKYELSITKCDDKEQEQQEEEENDDLEKLFEKLAVTDLKNALPNNSIAAATASV